MVRRGSVLTVAVVCAGLLASGCGAGTTSGGGPDDPFRVLVTGGLSAPGVLAANSKTSILAAQAGADRVNKRGGIGGRRIEVEVVDDGGDPTTAATKLREAIAERRPDAYVNSGPSTVAAATLPVLRQNKILSFSIGPTETSADPEENPLNFDLAPSAADFSRSFARQVQTKKYRTVGVLHGSSSYGEAFGKAVRATMAREHVRIVGFEQYDDAALDMTPQMQALQAKKPDALLLQGYGAPVGYLLKSLDKLGWKVPVLADSSISATSLISTAPPDGVLGTDRVDGVSLQTFTSTVHDPKDALVNEAVTAMRKRGRIPSTLINAYQYDVFPLLEAAAKKVGRANDPERLATALESAAVQRAAQTAILRGYRFTDSSHSPHARPESFSYVAPSTLRNGQFRRGN